MRDERTAKVEGILRRNALHYRNWAAVETAVAATGLDVRALLRDVVPEAEEEVVQAFTWGVAVALRNKSNILEGALMSLAQGVQDFTWPDSPAEQREGVRAYAEATGWLLRRWQYTLAILDAFAAPEAVRVIREVAALAGPQRQQGWAVVCLGWGPERAEAFAREQRGKLMQVDYDEALGRVRGAVPDPQVDLPPESENPVPLRVYGVPSIKRGLAVLHHELVAVTFTVGVSSLIRFAHPVAGGYRRQTLNQDRLCRAITYTPLTGRSLDGRGLAGFSDAMAGMYADVQLLGAGADADEMERLGFVRISSAGLWKALLTIAPRVAAGFRRPRSEEY